MSKFIYCCYPFKGAALISFLAFVLIVPAWSQTPCPSPTPGCVAISSVQIATAGSLYKVGDILDPLFGNLCGPGDNYGFRLRVASVASPGQQNCGQGGCVTGVTVVPCAGIGYSAPPSNPIRFGGSPTGTGFTANCTFN